ncbi:unnamed protein product [Trichobilharzia regenti]|nr:unnamed protein product [Trichobilharzia regenti]
MPAFCIYSILRFIENQDCGLNISVAGGFKQINNSLFNNNFGHGLIVWNLNQTNTPSRRSNGPLKTHVHLSNFTGKLNLFFGLLLYWFQ